MGNIPQTNRVYLKNRPACRDTASEIFWENANLMIAVSPGRNLVDKIGNIPQTNRVYLKNRPACRDTASEIFWENANLMIAVSPGRNLV
ncbi:hypothetical protein, partial [Microseira wollei]|uniref:hypothetical protein n=1 Tax=Microseira wollei TaxID=467598 RepID=UPI001CFE6072